MKTYTVGGAVRDQLLGLNVTDRDYVVVGMTPRQMIEAGFKPVGADFPVFLHPKTHEEYALARTERKTGPGYKGFTFHAAPTVTLEEDLARRDLTINAMARDDAGHIIDPYGGQADLNHKLLRHVGDAFREDPVRILRTARFAARFAQMGFTVAGETMALMREMVDAGEVDSLVAERVWQELARGLAEATPSRMFEVLRDCGALARIAPEIDRLWGVPQSSAVHPEIDTGVHVMMVIDYAAQTKASLPVRFAALTHDLGKAVTPSQFLPRHPGHEAKSVELIDAMCARLRIPAECRDLAVVVARWHGEIHNALGLSADKLLALLDGCDALRRPGRFVEVLDAAACDHHGRKGFAMTPYPPHDYLARALVRLQSIDFAHIASKHGAGVAAAIHLAKFNEMQTFINEEQ
ncbi:MAG: multifunctional CCA addition/repair protein [Rhodocyclaceae bacterium]|nr:multifunctional CCA addition/repair protein [Rhodocyclaceae bacterium]